MQWLSETLLPVSRGRSSKLHDRGLSKLLQGGYALWNPNDGKLILLPAGQKLFQRAQDFLLDALADFRPQLIDAGGSARGALDAAVRVVKRAGDLPLLLVQRREDTLELLGLHTDPEASMEMANDALRAVGSAVSDLGVNLRREDRTLDDGRAVDLASAATEPLRGEEGLLCPTCGWLAAPDSPFRVAVPPAAAAQEELREISTPGCNSIESLCNFLGIPQTQSIKCMVYTASGRGLIVVILRGDRQVCLNKLRAALNGAEVRHAEPAELQAVMGDSAGYMGPVRLPAGATLLADYSTVGMQNAPVGANKKGFHLTGACWGRDYTTDFTADVTLVQEGDTCPHCGGALKKNSLRRIARFRPVDPACAAESSLSFFNGQKKLRVPAWSATVDLTSLLSAVIEGAGVWPQEVAAADDYVCWDGDAPAALPRLLEALAARGRRVIADDRAGKKFPDRLAEAEAFAAPETVILREEGGACLAEVRGGEAETLPLEEFIARLQA